MSGCTWGALWAQLGTPFPITHPSQPPPPTFQGEGVSGKWVSPKKKCDYSTSCIHNLLGVCSEKEWKQGTVSALGCYGTRARRCRMECKITACPLRGAPKAFPETHQYIDTFEFRGWLAMGMMWTGCSQLTSKLILKVNSLEFITPSPTNIELYMLVTSQEPLPKAYLHPSVCAWCYGSLSPLLGNAALRFPARDVSNTSPSSSSSIQQTFSECL